VTAPGGDTRQPDADRFFVRHAWLFIAGPALLLAAGVVGMMATGANPPMQFEADTGVPWAELMAAYPSVATLVSLEDLLLGVSFGGLGLLTAIVAATRFRAGERWAWFALWVFPVVLAAVAALMFTHDQAYVAVYYVGAAAVCVLGLALTARRALGRTARAPFGRAAPGRAPAGGSPVPRAGR